MDTISPPTTQPDLAALLRWHLEAGVDETIGEEPINRYAATSSPAAPIVVAARPAPAAPVLAPGAPKPTSAHLAQECKTLAELKLAVESYDGCALKSFATRTVFADGNPNARVMVIGEAPGEDEDRQGLPFVGVSGKLLDRMLGSIGLDRATNAYITNVVFWRPPGNRKPTAEEIVLCLPFVQRHIELLDPALLLLVGGPAASTILANPQGITKIRGKWFDYETPGLPRPVPTMATFHPAYLLRSPQQKRFAWRDLLTVKQKLDSLGVA
ncbi:MAG: uracil-DNA glycosylase [Rhodospirillaceae bacterium]|nr:uracil-DNA glycosylase [Rhodospirillaceae bacterium]